MAKYYGKIGYGIEEETAPGVYEVMIVERSYYGDVLRNSRRYENSDKLNDELKLSNRISIVADAYAYDHAADIRYAIVMGSKWKVTDLEIERPRMILTLGGVWHGDES